MPNAPYTEIECMTDENGRFSVDNVPAGLVKVGIPYMIFDLLCADEWAVQVVEGKTTEVRILDPVRSRPMPVEFRFGDGSKAHYESATGFGAKRKVKYVTSRLTRDGDDVAGPRRPGFRVDLIPRPGQAISFVDPDWEELDGKKQIVLTDVSPGSYRLRVIDWLGDREFEEGTLFERDVNLPADALPIKIPLGAGSITGRYQAAGRYSDPGAVVAVPRGGNASVRRARCDEDGNFCVRYLDPGNYTLFAHDPKAGWARVENVIVASNVTDVGERQLSPGATIRGSLSFRRPCRLPDLVVAVDSTGASLRFPITWRSGFDRFELAHLWPGRWTISVLSGENVIAKATAEISGTEKIQLDLAAADVVRP